MRTFQRKQDVATETNGERTPTATEESVKKLLQTFVHPEVKEDPQAEVAGYGNLVYPELCEEQLKEYHLLKKKLKDMEDLAADLRSQIIANVKQGRGNFQYGKYVLKATETAGRMSTDWKKFTQKMVELINKPDVEKAKEECTSQGEAALKIEVDVIQ